MKKNINNFSPKQEPNLKLFERFTTAREERQFFIIKRNVMLGVAIIIKEILNGEICFWEVQVI